MNRGLIGIRPRDPIKQAIWDTRAARDFRPKNPSPWDEEFDGKGFPSGWQYSVGAGVIVTWDTDSCITGILPASNVDFLMIRPFVCAPNMSVTMLFRAQGWVNLQRVYMNIITTDSLNSIFMQYNLVSMQGQVFSNDAGVYTQRSSAVMGGSGDVMLHIQRTGDTWSSWFGTSAHPGGLQQILKGYSKAFIPTLIHCGVASANGAASLGRMSCDYVRCNWLWLKP